MVCVTGGAGFIGSHVARALLEAGLEVVVLDDLSRGHEAAVAGLELARVDLRDGAAVKEVLSSWPIEAVVHLAGESQVGASMRDPGLYWRANVLGSLNLIEGMVELGIRHLVFSSSCTIFGIPDVPLIHPDLPLRPISPYGASKVAVEQMMVDFSHTRGLRWVSLRYFNAAGAHPSGEIGERHAVETHLIPLAMDAVSSGEPLTVFGDDYPTPDGTCVRDYVHVCDLATAHVRALGWLDEGRPSRAFNLGSGRGHSVREVLAEVERVAGRGVPHRIGARRPGDPPHLVADITRAREELGWLPTRSDLPTIVGTAWRWHCEPRY